MTKLNFEKGKWIINIIKYASVIFHDNAESVGKFLFKLFKLERIKSLSVINIRNKLIINEYIIRTKNLIY